MIASTARLEAALASNGVLSELLASFDEIALPDGWIVAGAIAQTVWNAAMGRPGGDGIKDVDIVYFDRDDLSAETEAVHERRLRDRFRHLPVTLDVKNEARVHLWYERRFGYPIAPYRSAADAIATFPTIATSIGVRRNGVALEICAPFGTDDLFGLVVRPNRAQITRAIYEMKLERWRPIWPGLTFMPWDDPVPTP